MGRKRSKLILLFLAVSGLVVVSLVGFIQSESFANITKKYLVRYLPDRSGIHGDFQSFRIKLFPPGIAVKNPKVTLARENILDLPEDTRIEAESLDLEFLPVQLFSRDISIHRLVISKGHIDLDVTPGRGPRVPHEKDKADPSGPGLTWKEIIGIGVETVSFQDSTVKIRLPERNFGAEFYARDFTLSKVLDPKDPGVQLHLDLDRVKAEFPASWTRELNLPDEVQTFRADLFLNSKGVRIDSIEAAAAGVNLSVNGALGGNLLDPRALKLDAQVGLEGDLEKTAKILQTKQIAKGQVGFKGQIKVDLLNFHKTLEAKGEVTGRNIQYQDWNVDRLKVSGEWVAETKDIRITSAVFDSEPSPRIGGFHPGRGGHVEAGPFAVSLGALKELRVALKLENAHSQWLGALALDDLYPLDFAVSGDLDLTLTDMDSADDWAISVRADLKIPKFQFDNQRWKVSRPIKKVIEARDISLSGLMEIDRTGFYPRNVDLRLPKTHLVVSGGIDFQTGYDLKAAGNIALSDFQGIAENKINGTGPFALHVTGKKVNGKSNVLIDFDLDLKDTMYLNLDLGGMKGRVVWDDGAEQVLFKGIHIQKNLTGMDVTGRLDVSKTQDPSSEVQLDIDKITGDIQDLGLIFGQLTKELSWYPASLTGHIEGSATVRGEMSSNGLDIIFDGSGRDWDFYGEKMRSVGGRFAFERGRYSLRRATILKNQGLLSGDISYDPQKGLQWTLRSEGLGLVDLDHVARLDVPIRGKLSLFSEGSGLMGKIKSTSQLRIEEVVVRGQPLAPTEGTLITQDGVWTAKSRLNGQQAEIGIVYHWAEGDRSELHLDMNQLNFTPALLLLNPGLIHDPALRGEMTGRADIVFRSGALERGTGKIFLDTFLLKKTGSRLFLDQPVELQLSDGTFSRRTLVLRGDQGDLKYDIEGEGAGLTGRAVGTIDLSLLEFLSSAISKAEGLADFRMNLTGNKRDPIVTGNVQITNGRAKFEGFDQSIEEMQAQIDLRQSVLAVQRFEGRLAGGTVTAGGRIELFASKVPRLALNGTLSRAKLKIFPFSQIDVSGPLTLHGEALPYVVTGDLKIHSGISRERLSARRAAGKQASRFEPPATALTQSDRQVFELKIRARADGNVFIKNDLVDMELRGDLTVINSLSVPRIVGEVEMLSGSLQFKDRKFVAESAGAEFDNPVVINPKFNLSARTEVKGVKIRLFASGRMEDWKAELSSEPALPESEILSLLAVGFTSEDFQRLSGDQATAQQTEAASVVLHSLEISQDVKEKTGFQIQLDKSVNTQDPTSLFRPTQGSSSNISPKIVIKRSFGEKVDVSVGSTVGIGSNVEREANAEYHFTSNVSGALNWKTFEGQGTGSEQNSWGFDLKLKRRFE